MTLAVKFAVTAVVNVQIAASAVDATAAVVAVAAMNAVIVPKVALKDAQRVAVNNAVKVAPKIAMKVALRAEAMSALNAVTSRAARSSVTRSRVKSNVSGNAMSSAVNNEAKARSSASHAHRVNHVKVAAKSAHAVSAANAMSETVSSAHRWTPRSRILPWLTRPLWPRPWAARPPTLRQMPRAVNVVSAVAATTNVLHHV